jgi:hypothetical protein
MAMAQLKTMKPEQSREIISRFLENDPGFNRLLDHLRESLPGEILEQAANCQDWLLEQVVIEMQGTLEKLDIQALAKAVLSNESLKGQVAIEIHDLGFGLSSQIKQAIIDQIRDEREQIQNLLAARRALERADNQAILKERDKLKREREFAKAKGQLLWYRLSALQVAVPTILAFLLFGVFLGVNYPEKVACSRDDPVCQLRFRSVFWY